MEVDKILYNEIKEYCVINSLKPREYIHNLLKKAFMEDKYGKMPTCLNKKEIDKADNEFAEIVKNVGGIDKFNDLVDECIMSSNTIETKEVKIEPEKKIVKTIKRKLNE